MADSTLGPGATHTHVLIANLVAEIKASIADLHNWLTDYQMPNRKLKLKVTLDLQLPPLLAPPQFGNQVRQSATIFKI